MPKLRINRMYADILPRNRDASFQQLAGQLQEAKWLIKNVQQRFDTILRVSQAIVDRQRHFFEHGEVAMRPLVLREIAETLGSARIHRVPRHDPEVHAHAARHFRAQVFLRQSCRHRNRRRLFRHRHPRADQADWSAPRIRKKPLSDSQISEILGQQGIVVARRTVAKYRESLQILPVNLRKSI